MIYQAAPVAIVLLRKIFKMEEHENALSEMSDCLSEEVRITNSGFEIGFQQNRNNDREL